MACKRLLSLKNALWCVGTAAALVLSSLSGVYVAAGTAQAASSASAARPCDIYAAGHTPCVGAYSTVRALPGHPRLGRRDGQHRRALAGRLR